MSNNFDIENKKCLDEFIKEVNDELMVSCQIPFNLPSKEIKRIIDKAKEWFYKMYEDSVEEMYISIPSDQFRTLAFRSGITNDVDSLRGIITMPERVFSVNGVYEMGRFSGEDGGSGRHFSSADPDFSIGRFIYNDQFGAGIAGDNLMYFVINSMFVDNARQITMSHIGYSYNRLTRKFRFQGKVPKNDVVFQVYVRIPDCNLFTDEIFYRYVVAKSKMQISRVLGTFNYNLPGNITINYDMIRDEGQNELDTIIEQIKEDDAPDYFLTQ